jgi:dolichyl-phosphate-mannose--protein O-mannosyl transferase
MIFYFALFLAFLYFKIARVHRKEERMKNSMRAQHLVVGFSVLSLFIYGARYLEWYAFVPFLFIFATIASLMVTTIQLGIFVDGKPLLGITEVYKKLPVLSVSIIASTAFLWLLKFGVI